MTPLTLPHLDFGGSDNLGLLAVPVPVTILLAPTLDVAHSTLGDPILATRTVANVPRLEQVA